jgi:hypothetical protein
MKFDVRGHDGVRIKQGGKTEEKIAHWADPEDHEFRFFTVKSNPIIISKVA